MLYTMFGSTGVEVSRIGFGGMRFSNREPPEKNAALLKTAYDRGIRYFDTAPAYGNSEDIYGLAFKEMKKTRAHRPFYVATKTFRAEPSDIRKDLETSLRRMGLDYIDFYYCWCILSLDEFRDRKAKGALREFERLKDEGLIRHLCVSTHMPGADIAVLLRDYPFESVLLGYSAMNFAYREAGLDGAASAARGVAVMNPLGGGLIPQNPERFAFVQTHPGESVVAGALKFLLNDARIHVLLVGFSSEAEIAEAVEAADTFTPLTPAEVLGIRMRLKQTFNELCTGCQYCDSCPQGIPIPKLMDAYNQYLLTGKTSAVHERLKWHWDIAVNDPCLRNCTECGACEAVCTQKLPIVQRLKDLRRIVEQGS